MRTVVFLISFAVSLLHNAVGYSMGENLLDRLNSQIDSMNQLIDQVEKTYRDDMYHHPVPRNYESTLRTADLALDRASRVVEKIRERYCRYENQAQEDDFRRSFSSEKDFGGSTRRSNNELMWKINFYKALSRALKEEFKDEPLVQEHVHDGFTPPTWLKKQGQ